MSDVGKAVTKHEFNDAVCRYPSVWHATEPCFPLRDSLYLTELSIHSA